MKFQIMAVAVAVLAVTVGPVVQTATATSCTPSVSIANAVTVYEDKGPLAFTVTMTAPPNGCEPDGSVYYHTMPSPTGQPAPGLDYEAKDELLALPLHGPAALTIQITLKPDAIDEGQETLKVCLYSPAGVTIGNDCAQGIILSTPVCAGPAPGQSASCGIPIDLPESSRTPVTVTYITVDGTAVAGEDFVGIVNGSLTIPADETRGRVAVEILPGRPGDPVEEFGIDYRLTRDTGTESGRIPVMIGR